jgi:hypothetical protein
MNRPLLERCLELCNKISLIDLYKYPEAGYLIPLLQNELEQEEICTHSFIDGVCVACNHKN